MSDLTPLPVAKKIIIDNGEADVLGIGFIIFENLCLARSDTGFWGLRFNLFRYFVLMAVIT